MRRCLQVALLLLLATSPPARAQMAEVQPGARVRLEAPGVVAARYEGTVFTRDPDTLVVGAPSAAPIHIPIARITWLEISRGKSRADGAKRGIVWGVPIGLAAGLLTYSTSADCTTRCGDANLNPHSASFIAWSAAAGVIYGAGIGALVARERWERFYIAPRSAFNRRDGRAHLGFALQF